MRAALFSFLLLTVVPLAAQTPSPPKAPAEIVPPKPPSTPALGHQTIEGTTTPTTLSPGTAKAAAAASGATSQDPLDRLSDADLAEVIAALKQRYTDPAALSDDELKRATVQGLLERLKGRAVLDAGAPPATSSSPFREEMLSGKTGYVRLGTLDSPHLANLDAALEKFAKASVKAEVLDLRATPAGSDFDLAAEVCRRWVSKGKPLFTVQRRGSAAGLVFTSKGDAAGQGMLVVLISAENAGSAEVIAGTLRLLAHAIVIGQKTRGQAVEMTETTLSSGAHLRFAVGEVKLANGEKIGPEGVTPDLPVVMSIEATAQILAKEQEQGIAATQAEPERPRLNEAALVAGRNPEIDALENAPRLRVNGKIPHDATLQRALDLVASVAVFGPPKK